jgi:hypothetical protein
MSRRCGTGFHLLAKPIDENSKGFKLAAAVEAPRGLKPFAVRDGFVGM